MHKRFNSYRLASEVGLGFGIEWHAKGSKVLWWVFAKWAGYIYL